MVLLSLVPLKGNSGSRFFPHSGFLGLSPLKVEGVVRVSLSEDARPIPARDVSVSVRCYEARLGRSGIVRSHVLVDHSVTLWTKNPELEYESLATSEWPFRIILPPSVTGYSSLALPDYRVFWRVEAVITHIPQFGVGNRLTKFFDLRLSRYDLPPTNLFYNQSSILHTSRPGRPNLRYSISSPTDPLGPTDLLPVDLSLFPLDSSIRIHTVNVQLERRILLFETSPISPATSLSVNSNFLSVESFSSTPPSPTSDGQDPPLSQNPSSIALSSTTTLPPSVTSTSDIPLLGKRLTISPHSTSGNLPAKSNTTVVTHLQSPLSPNEDGNYKKRIALVLPPPKSSAHWSQGVTMTTGLVSLRFFIRIQVTVSSHQSSQESIELEEREVFIIATNQSERTVASNRLESLAVLNGRSKNKSSMSTNSHRRRRDKSDEPEASPRYLMPNIPSSMSSKPSKASRRPHTSGGMRDSSSSLVHGHHRSSFNPLSNPTVPRSIPILPSLFPLRTFADPPTGTSDNVYLNSPTAPRLLPSLTPSQPQGLVKDWEEELERIASQSSRGSAEQLGRRSITVSRTDPQMSRSLRNNPRPVPAV